VSNRCLLYTETLWISPYVFSSFVALTEKRVDFDVAEISLFDRDHLAQEYSTRSLTARVPCLEIEGFALSESSAIAEYLEERFPAPHHSRLFPEAIEQRARARQLMAWLRSDLGVLREDRSTITMFYRFALPPLSKAAERDAHKLLRVADALITPDAGPLFGEWSLVDSELSFMLHRLLLNDYDVPARVRRYAEREWQRPSVQAFVKRPRPTVVPDRYWLYSGSARPPTK
jgi:glutathione S-transferase